MLSASLKKNYKGLLFLLMGGGGGEMEWPILFYIRFSYKHCNFSHVCLLVKIENRDKVYWFERMRSLLLREVFMDVAVDGSGKVSNFTSQ